MTFSARKRSVRMGKFFVGFSSFNGIIGGGFGGQYDSIETIFLDHNRFIINMAVYINHDCWVVIHE